MTTTQTMTKLAALLLASSLFVVSDAVRLRSVKKGPPPPPPLSFGGKKDQDQTRLNHMTNYEDFLLEVVQGDKFDPNKLTPEKIYENIKDLRNYPGNKKMAERILKSRGIHESKVVTQVINALQKKTVDPTQTNLFKPDQSIGFKLFEQMKKKREQEEEQEKERERLAVKQQNEQPIQNQQKDDVTILKTACDDLKANVDKKVIKKVTNSDIKTILKEFYKYDASFTNDDARLQKVKQAFQEMAEEGRC